MKETKAMSATATSSSKPARPVRVEATGPAERRQRTPARLILADGTQLAGWSFGARKSSAGEVVFNTGMVGYTESMTDPSYLGQILVCTFPLIGNYGIPAKRTDELGLCAGWESDRIQVAGLVVSDYTELHSHWNASMSLGQWMEEAGIPGITGIDTRTLTQRLREHGSMLGRIEVAGDTIPDYDPNAENLVAKASITTPKLYGKSTTRIALLDCGAKHNIIRSLVKRGAEVLRLPWNADLADEKFDGLMVSNGPGDPAFADAAAQQVRWAIDNGRPTFGICMGNQVLARAIGASTYKLPYGHRGQNQPVIECGTDRCFVTSQNHGFAVDNSTLPRDWRPWYANLNDGTNEGVRHQWAPYRSVQFHPEACPGPTDAAFLFDEFVRMISK